MVGREHHRRAAAAAVRITVRQAGTVEQVQPRAVVVVVVLVQTVTEMAVLAATAATHKSRYGYSDEMV